jgi:hypothetical protein
MKSRLIFGLCRDRLLMRSATTITWPATMVGLGVALSGLVESHIHQTIARVGVADAKAALSSVSTQAGHPEPRRFFRGEGSQPSIL